jgi:hypothetical protein
MPIPCTHRCFHASNCHWLAVEHCRCRLIAQLYPLDANAKRALELLQFQTLFAPENRGSDSAFTRAACTAHAMNEILRDVRQIVINHMRDILHVNAARSQVRSDQNPDASLLKSSQSCRALRLRTPAVNHRSSDSFAVQAFRQPLGPVLGAHENQASPFFFR